MDDYKQIARYRGLSDELAQKIAYNDAHYCAFDEPIPLGSGFMLHPVKVRDYDDFMSSTACLTLDRIHEPNGAGLHKTDLDFLLLKMQDEKTGAFLSRSLLCVLELSTGLHTSGVFCPKCKNAMAWQEGLSTIKDPQPAEDPKGAPPKMICPKCGGEMEGAVHYAENAKTHHMDLIICGQTMTAAEFDDFRHMVLFQNLPDYFDESNIDPALKADRFEKARLDAKKHPETATLEEKMACVAAATGMSFSSLYDLSIRKFLLLLEKVNALVNYRLMKQAELTGLVKFDKPVSDWISTDHTKDMYGEYKSLADVESDAAAAQSGK